MLILGCILFYSFFFIYTLFQLSKVLKSAQKLFKPFYKILFTCQFFYSYFFFSLTRITIALYSKFGITLRCAKRFYRIKRVYNPNLGFEYI